MNQVIPKEWTRKSCISCENAVWMPCSGICWKQQKKQNYLLKRVVEAKVLAEDGCIWKGTVKSVKKAECMQAGERAATATGRIQTFTTESRGSCSAYWAKPVLVPIKDIIRKTMCTVQKKLNCAENRWRSRTLCWKEEKKLKFVQKKRWKSRTFCWKKLK